MSAHFRQTTLTEFDAVVQFYSDVIDNLVGAKYHPAWSLDTYPTRDDLRRFVESGATHMYDIDGEIAGIANLDSNFPDDFEQVPWGIEARPENVLAVHTFAIAPRFEGQGVGRKFVDAIVDHARTSGYRAIRLDVYPANLSARRFYESCGFHYRGQHTIAYPDITENFHMYEYIV